VPVASILHGDATALPLQANSIDAIVCDPPYELAFMAKDWDSAGVAFDPQTWAEAFRVLKPGGYLLAFGGSRTWHRLACAIEDAGFELRDSIAWMYGSGFPKSLDVSKAIDKAAGAEREVVGRYKPPNGQEWNLADDEAAPGDGGTMGKFDAFVPRRWTSPPPRLTLPVSGRAGARR
jgi:DNA modification methylase